MVEKALLGMTLLFTLTLQGGETPAERGRQLYMNGSSANGGVVTARIGEPPVEVPASAMPCVNCHGPDGHGRAEGGVYPSDITWAALTRPYSVTNQSGRTRAPYTEPLVKRAMVAGIDSSGNKLNTSMPRFQLTMEDANDLIAWLKLIGEAKDPGIEPDRLVFGVLLAPRPYRGHAASVRSAVNAFVQSANNSGGVYGRRLTPVFLTLPQNPGERETALTTFLNQQKPFALVASFLVGAEKSLIQTAANRNLPMIGPYSLNSPKTLPPNRYAFHLYPEIRELGVELTRHAAASGRKTAAILYSQEFRDAAKSQVDACATNGWTTTPEMVALHSGQSPEITAQRLFGSGVEQLFYMGSPSAQETTRFYAKAAELGWRPQVYIPAPLANQALFSHSPSMGRFILAMATPPDDGTRPLPRGYEAMRAAFGLPERPNPTQAHALAAMEIFHGALLGTGRDTSREKLVTQLETLYHYQTGYTPPITYTPNRRVGSLEAYLVQYKHQLQQFTEPGL